MQPVSRLFSWIAGCFILKNVVVASTILPKKVVKLVPLRLFGMCEIPENFTFSL